MVLGTNLSNTDVIMGSIQFHLETQFLIFGRVKWVKYQEKRIQDSILFKIGKALKLLIREESVSSK